MKHFVIPVLLLSFAINTSRAQTTFTAKEAINHRNKYITVCDTVYESRLLNPYTRLMRLGSAKGSHALHVVLKSRKKMNAASVYIGIPFCIDGIVRLQKGRYTLYTSKKIMYMGPIDM